MRIVDKRPRIAAVRRSDDAGNSALRDLRFRKLLTQEAWDSLPLPIRQRFSKRLAGGKTAIYVGEILETRMSLCGWLLAQLARLAGGPLPTSRDKGVESVVTVTEDRVGGGQVWTRLYARRKGFPQVIHSAKRFAGATGLEEYLGFGIGMALSVQVENAALVFRSAFYYLRVAGRRLILPRLLGPGALTVTHAEMGGGRFSFTLDLTHPLFGNLIHQIGLFRETGS
jgi:hypothetical protein